MTRNSDYSAREAASVTGQSEGDDVEFFGAAPVSARCYQKQAMDGRRQSGVLSRPCTTPSIAAPSGSKARMFEHRDVRVRAGPLGARSTGAFRQHDVAETVVPGAWLWLLSPKGK